MDEEGFLQQPELWDDEVAKLFATTEGISDMTPEHWAVVRMIRDYYLQHGTRRWCGCSARKPASL